MVRVTIAALACVASLAASGQEPQWLTDARAREASPAEPHALNSKDDWFRARVPARTAGDIEKVEGSYTVTFDIGTDSPVFCEVVPESFDLADMLRRTFELSMKQVAEAQGKVEATQLEFSDAGAVGSVPYLAARWLYRVNDGKEQRLGALKQVVFEKSGHGVYCAHLDLGYVKTFDAIYRAFAQSFEAPAAGAEPYYTEIMVTSLGDSRIGVSTTTLEKDADGDTKAKHVSAIFVQDPTGQPRSQDSTQLEWSGPDAALINAAHFVSTNGELTTDLKLNPREDEWAVEGKLQGKEVNLSLPADPLPGSLVAQALELRRLLAAENAAGAEHTMPLWISADPSRLTDVRTRLIEKRGETGFAAHASLGGVEVDLVLDKATGMALSADLPVGQHVVHMERVYQDGSF